MQNTLAGNYLSTFHGTGLEFSEVREYAPGDEVRLIDWNVTARLGIPFIKVFREERELTIILAVDISASSEFGSRGSSKRELAAQIAATLGFAAVQNQDRVGFLLFSDQVEAFLPPRRGKRHLLRGIRDILVLKPKGQGTDFGPAFKRLGSMARRGATVFVVSDFQAPRLEEDLRAAINRYDLVAARLNDPLEEDLPAFAGMLALRDPETGRRAWVDTDSFGARRRFKENRKKVKETATRSLRRLQMDSFEATTGADFTPGLLKFFRRREMRVRH